MSVVLEYGYSHYKAVIPKSLQKEISIDKVDSPPVVETIVVGSDAVMWSSDDDPIIKHIPPAKRKSLSFPKRESQKMRKKKLNGQKLANKACKKNDAEEKLSS